jgi:hypothetical protein
MTSVSRSIEQGGEARVSIDADTPAELFAEVAMLMVRTPDPVRRAWACARVATVPVIQWAEELEAVGYHRLSIRSRAGRWHAEILLH